MDESYVKDYFSGEGTVTNWWEPEMGDKSHIFAREIPTVALVKEGASFMPSPTITMPSLANFLISSNLFSIHLIGLTKTTLHLDYSIFDLYRKQISSK
ncbi:hypothetical protein LCGC14_2715780 [marine sediment metagenome]|uniref:Uncharacterized protein n=1 Tax=marine sediment metagenome TaxID=412755 RepID=A0A0F8ZBG7_9ZZZZ